MSFWPWDTIGKRYAPLRPLTKIYVGAAVFIVGFGAMLAFASLGASGSFPYLFAAVAFVVVAAAAPIERLVLKLAERRLQSNKSDPPQN